MTRTACAHYIYEDDKFLKDDEWVLIGKNLGTDEGEQFGTIVPISHDGNFIILM